MLTGSTDDKRAGDSPARDPEDYYDLVLAVTVSGDPSDFESGIARSLDGPHVEGSWANPCEDEGRCL